MQARWVWLTKRFFRQLWVRALLFSLLGIATAFLALVIKPHIPDDLSTKIGSQAVDEILTIVASSMLAVTTFTLSIMVSAYSAAASSASPRATHLLISDPTTQNVVATFLGSFLFCIVGIVALRTGVYGDQGRVVLFAVTIVVIGVIVLTMLRWFDHLTTFGRLDDTASRVEAAACKAIEDRKATPFLGCRPIRDRAATVPLAAHRVCARSIGYVQHIDVEALEEIAKDLDTPIFIDILPGSLADLSRPLVLIARKLDAEREDEIRALFTIDDIRTYDQDPRFGLIVLSEIASRALSPAVNDPGTAIDIVGRQLRLLTQWVGSVQDENSDEEVACPHVYAPCISATDMVGDAFHAIARDGAGTFEVVVRLQKALRALTHLGDADLVAAARAMSRQSLERSQLALVTEHEKKVIRALVREVSGNAEAAHRS